MCASASWVGLLLFFPFGWCRKGTYIRPWPLMGRSLTSIALRRPKYFFSSFRRFIVILAVGGIRCLMASCSSRRAKRLRCGHV